MRWCGSEYMYTRRWPAAPTAGAADAAMLLGAATFDWRGPLQTHAHTSGEAWADERRCTLFSMQKI